MTVRVGINGFGRIGRNFLRAALETNADIEIVAANDLAPLGVLANLLAYDSVQGNFEGDVHEVDGGISVDGKVLPVSAEREPANLGWGDKGVDVVVEATGRFSNKEASSAHIAAGAKLVIVSAPCKEADKTIVYGVNHDSFDPKTDTVISNASCTTNSFVPMVQVLDDAFGIQNGLMTTIHSYTGTQNLVDGPHKDPRRSRAAAINIIPTTTGAARATTQVLESMAGKLDGAAVRVPVPTGSLTDFTCVVSKEATVEAVNAAFKAAAENGPLASVLDYTERPIVSSDIVHDPASCIFDSGMTMVQGNLIRTGGWYDNEWGYSNRIVDLVTHVGKQL